MNDNGSGSFVLVNPSEYILPNSTAGFHRNNQAGGIENVDDSEMNQSFGPEMSRLSNQTLPKNPKTLTNYVENEEDLISPEPKIPKEQEANEFLFPD